MPVHAVKRTSPLQAELARQIVELAGDEAWPEGSHVPELALARRMGVSRSPVRGALNLLASRGLVRLEPGRGFILVKPVASIAEADLVPPSAAEDLFTVMMTERATGRLPQEISESELSERFGAARGAVRKVLLRFAAEGLVQRQRGHGWRFVDTLDTDEAVAESYRFRIILECAALREPNFAVDRARLGQLRRAHEDILARASGAVTREEWFRINSWFHESLATWSGNRFMAQAVRQQNSLRRMQEYADFSVISPSRIVQSCREHIGILTALDEDDLTFAEALLRRHLSLAAQANECRQARGE